MPSGVPPRHPSLSSFDTLDILRLIRSENVGPVTFFELIRRYRTPAKALEMIPELSARGGRRRPIAVCPKSLAETELEKTRLFGATYISYGSQYYPAALTQVADPPPLLSILGEPDMLKSVQMIAMVGARNASANGCNFARRLARELGQAGYTVISGLARGIDTHAHRGALETGTIGVIASGIDIIYPPENTPLYHEMHERGVLVSENPLGASPQGRSFPARNRIIAGMSLGVVIVEAAHKSGSLITAEYALEQGREIFAVPGSPMDPRCKGTNGLIRDGATITESLDDILNALKNTGIGRVSESRSTDFEQEVAQPLSETEMEKARHFVTDMPSHDPVAVEDLLEMTGLPVSAVQTVLLEKELAGTIQRHPGGKVSLLFQEATELA